MILKWALEHGYGVIPKCSSIEKLKKNFECMNVPLTKEDVELIDKSCNGKEKKFYWDPSKVV